MKLKQLHSAKPGFQRDSLTWLAYLFLAYYAFMPTAIGPVLPFLRSELGINYTLGGLHLSAISLGIVLGGLLTEYIVHSLGRKKTWWLSACSVAVGVLGFALGNHAAITIISVFWIGLSGSWVLVLSQSILSDHHGVLRAVALTEANIGASLSSALAPVIISLLVMLGWSWRSAFYLQFLYLILLGLFFLKLRVPDPVQNHSIEKHQQKRKLSTRFWLFWIGIVFFVSVEWCMWVWGADFFVSVHGLNKATATMMVSLYLSMGVLSRIVISRLTRSFPTISLLVLSIGICLLGFPLFWMAKWIPLALMGYILTGLGVTNLYPLGMSMALGSAPHQSDLASSRVSMGIGLAGFSAPLILGWMADKVGIQAAFGSVVVLLACVSGLTLWIFFHPDQDHKGNLQVN